MKRLAALLLLVGVVLVPWREPCASATPALHHCHLKLSGGIFSGAQGVLIHGHCVPWSGSNPSGDLSGPPTRPEGCPIIGASAHARTGDLFCGNTPACVVRNQRTGDLQVVAPQGEFQLINGKWTFDGTTWCPTPPRPMPTAAQLRQHAIRLLPTVAIGTGWGGDGLINAETILWADTTTDRTLPNATIVGRNVAFRIHLETAHWNFGDNTTATWHTPGTPYDATSNPCSTAQCPDYNGHTYRQTGTMTQHLTITWTAQYAVDGAAWQNLGPLTGPDATNTLTIDQARGILVNGDN